MHKIVKSAEPNFLLSIRKKNITWDDFSEKYPQEKKCLSKQLIEDQKGLCAYCEKSIKDGDGHIEHFIKRSLKIELTFNWNNLFYSCMGTGAETHCGKHKDPKIKELTENKKLIHPVFDTPEDYFEYSIDGHISVNTNLQPQEKERANYTIKIFNLNSPSLVNKRQNWWKQISSILKNYSDKKHIEEVLEFYLQNQFVSMVKFLIPY